MCKIFPYSIKEEYQNKKYTKVEMQCKLYQMELYSSMIIFSNYKIYFGAMK